RRGHRRVPAGALLRRPEATVGEGPWPGPMGTLGRCRSITTASRGSPARYASAWTLGTLIALGRIRLCRPLPGCTALQIGLEIVRLPRRSDLELDADGAFLSLRIRQPEPRSRGRCLAEERDRSLIRRDRRVVVDDMALAVEVGRLGRSAALRVVN